MSETGAGDPLQRAKQLHREGHAAEARDLLLALMATDRGSAAAARLLALIERDLGDVAGEAHALEAALRGDGQPGQPPLWKRLAALRTWQGDPDAAADAYARAVALDPDDLAAHEGLARAALARQDLAHGRSVATTMAHRFPDAPFTHLLAGHLAKVLGHPQEAVEHYRRALELDAGNGEALYNLVDAAPPAPNDPIALHAAALTGREDAPPPDRINAAFAQHRILDAAAEYAAAFDALRQANELARDALSERGIVYDPQLLEARMRERISRYPAESFASSIAPLPVDIEPIFVLGMPRSGTTLIEQILSSHPDVEAAGELTVASRCEEAFVRERIAAGRSGAVDPDDPSDAEGLARARERYLDTIFEQGFDSPWVVDKLPANFEIAGFLRLMFPRAPIIHSLRDPRATCLSLYAANFAAFEPYYHDLEHLVHYHRCYQRLMEHWRSTLPAPFVEVVYETLSRDPERVIPGLLDAVGLEFHAACLAPHRQVRPVFTASHAAVRQPIHARAIDHWRHYADWLGPVLDLAQD